MLRRCCDDAAGPGGDVAAKGDAPLRSAGETLRFAPRGGETLRFAPCAGGRHSASLRARVGDTPLRSARGTCDGLDAKMLIIRPARPSTRKCPAHWQNNMPGTKAGAQNNPWIRFMKDCARTEAYNPAVSISASENVQGQSNRTADKSSEGGGEPEGQHTKVRRLFMPFRLL